MDHKRVAIIGGGLAGLEVAARLQDHGDIETHIFEPGSQARTVHIGWDEQRYAGDDLMPWPITATGWQPTGLPRRLGGRALCYTATLGPIDNETLRRFWPATWSERLPSLYSDVLKELEQLYPEMRPEETGRAPTAFAKRLGLSAVPQAATVSPDGHRFRAHTMLDQVIADANTTITQQQVVRLQPSAKGRWSVIHRRSPGSANGTPGVDYDACVLAASAIGNLSIIAQSLNTRITSQITDHRLVGAIMGAPNTPTTKLTTSGHHPKLWSGTRTEGELQAKLYICDLPARPLASYRPVDAGYEISPKLGVHSTIVCTPTSPDTTTLTITSPDSLFPAQREARIGRSLQQLAVNICETDKLTVIAAPDYQKALETLGRCVTPHGTIVLYEYPYGAEQHESCTHPIGGDGPSGVSEDLELHRMPGVFTIGSGNFPALGLSGPSLTTIAMSRWLADHIADRLAA